MSTGDDAIACNLLLSWNTLSQRSSIPMPMGKSLIFLVILVRDQEVGRNDRRLAHPACLRPAGLSTRNAKSLTVALYDMLRLS
jgi:hypothetical protein